MNKWIAVLFISSCPFLSASSWLPEALPIPEGASTGVDEIVNLVYDAANQTVIVAWGDKTTPAIPYFSVYNGTSWSTAATIPLGTGSGVSDDIGLAYNAANSTVVGAWGDSVASFNPPYYSVYNGTSWTTAATIPLGTSSGVDVDVGLAYYPGNSTVVAAWGDNPSGTHPPYYSVYNGTNWTTAATIPLGASVGVYVNISLIYDGANNTVMAAWNDHTDRVPYYSFFNGSSWTTAASIPLGASTGVLDNVALCYNAANNTVMAAWVDITTNLAYYTLYDGTSWTTPALIPLGESTGVYYIINLSYNSGSETVFAAWKDSVAGSPYYAIYNGSSWTTGAVIPAGTNVNICVSLAYDAKSDQMIAAWADSTSNQASFYSSYMDVLPPSSVQGIQKKNRFLTQTDIYNIISWMVPEGGTAPVSYRIYRDSTTELIGIVAANAPLTYQDHNRKKGIAYSYLIISVDANGNQSLPVTIIVNPH
ncbi:MAG: hypothetical protein WCF65_07510 [Parachlamydiaceae bacterium]